MIRTAVARTGAHLDFGKLFRASAGFAMLACTRESTEAPSSGSANFGAANKRTLASERRATSRLSVFQEMCLRIEQFRIRNLEDWSGRPGSNRRHPAWEAGVLPLNYSRSANDSTIVTHSLSGVTRAEGLFAARADVIQDGAEAKALHRRVRGEKAAEYAEKFRLCNCRKRIGSRQIVWTNPLQPGRIGMAE
jgi:hypothetical protein